MVGKSSDIMMRFYDCCFVIIAAFNNIRINRSLNKIIYSTYFFSFFFKNIYKFSTNNFSFLFRIGTPLSFSIKYFDASTLTKLISQSAKAFSTSSPSFFLRKPWSTKILVTCFPTAFDRSAAATELSTPPDRLIRLFYRRL